MARDEDGSDGDPNRYGVSWSRLVILGAGLRDREVEEDRVSLRKLSNHKCIQKRIVSVTRSTYCYLPVKSMDWQRRPLFLSHGSSPCLALGRQRSSDELIVFLADRRRDDNTTINVLSFFRPYHQNALSFEEA